MKVPSSSIAVTLVTIGLVLACGSQKQPTAPTPTTTTTPPASVRRLEMTAPASLEPGTSAQLVVSAVKTDNSVEDVTARSQWSTSNPQVIDIAQGGIAKGNEMGEATVTAAYLGWRTTVQILVLVRETYRLSGTATDAGVPLPRVAMTVISGSGEGLTATSDGNGAYALYGLSGHVRLQSKRDGYFNRVDELDVLDNRRFDFEMQPDHARPNPSGSYTLTITRASCASGSAATLPDSRSYDATIAQDGPRLAVSLSGADFIVTRGHGNTFTGVLDADNRVTFTMGAAYSYYYYYGQYDVVERISDTKSMIIDGRVTAGVTPAGITGTLSGEFLMMQGTSPPLTRILERCYASAHPFVMVRK